MPLRKEVTGNGYHEFGESRASPPGRTGETPRPSTGESVYFLNRSPIACFITWPPTSAIDLVSGMSLGQISTQFCA